MRIFALEVDFGCWEIGGEVVCQGFLFRFLKGGNGRGVASSKGGGIAPDAVTTCKFTKDYSKLQ